MNQFEDQRRFMKACDQTVDHYNMDQYNMYLKLIREETGELHSALMDADPVEQLDALIDILVVTIGAIHSAGFDAEGAWKEVMRSNFDKISSDGKVRRREDGKILKPSDWTPPELQQFTRTKND